MSKIDLSNISMSGYDDIFSSETNEVPAIKVALTELHEFKNHPFRVVDEDLEELVESIREQGVLEPGIVRPRIKGGYEIISGHRRRRACEIAGITEMPVRVMDYDDDVATIIMVDSNIHRDKILPSEKAHAYSMKFEKLKHQGKGGGKTLEKLSESSGETPKMIQRYIGLARLNDALLGLVDSNMIPLMAGYELSFLSKESQKWLAEVLEEHNIGKISLAQAAEIHNKSKEKDFAPSDIVETLLPVKAVKPKPFKFKQNKVNDYFKADTAQEKIETTIYDLLDIWNKNKDNDLFKNVGVDKNTEE